MATPVPGSGFLRNRITGLLPQVQAACDAVHELAALVQSDRAKCLNNASVSSMDDLSASTARLQGLGPDISYLNEFASEARAIQASKLSQLPNNAVGQYRKLVKAPDGSRVARVSGPIDASALSDLVAFDGASLGILTIYPWAERLANTHPDYGSWTASDQAAYRLGKAVPSGGYPLEDQSVVDAIVTAATKLLAAAPAPTSAPTSVPAAVANARAYALAAWQAMPVAAARSNGKPASDAEIRSASWSEHYQSVAMGIRRDKGGRDLVLTVARKHGLSEAQAEAAIAAAGRYRDGLQAEFDMWRKPVKSGPSPENAAKLAGAISLFDTAVIEAQARAIAPELDAQTLVVARVLMDEVRVGSQKRVGRRLREMHRRCLELTGASTAV